MTPLQHFACAITQACKMFQANRGIAAWLVFHETKQLAYFKLIEAVPQAKEIDDFWRYIQNMPTTEWLPIIEAEIRRITCRKSLCHDCGAVDIVWPEHLCIECKKTRRLNTYRKAKERARIRQSMRKCPRCNIEPLTRHQRNCGTCRANARRERNRRYQKSLKERKLRRLQDKFTTEALSTLPSSRLSTRAPKNVEQEGVLAGGVA